jgi:hypothetical protein
MSRRKPTNVGTKTATFRYFKPYVPAELRNEQEEIKSMGQI